MSKPKWNNYPQDADKLEEHKGYLIKHGYNYTLLIFVEDTQRGARLSPDLTKDWFYYKNNFQFIALEELDNFLSKD